MWWVSLGYGRNEYGKQDKDDEFHEVPPSSGYRFWLVLFFIATAELALPDIDYLLSLTACSQADLLSCHTSTVSKQE
jgi:hypothetical protein